MEALSETIAAACPLSFGGASGSVFLHAVATVIAAHCAIFADYHWPPDKAHDLIGQEGLSYDFIVVGAGTAGSLVASSLSNVYPHSSVLLVEAGEDPGVDSEIPAFLFMNQKTKTDWSYKTEPDGYSCLGFKNNSCIWSKGRGMGGSSSINAMLYIRGHPKDLIDWEDSINHWGYNDLKYYFNKIEETLSLSEVTRTNHEGWYKVIDDAWKQLGFTSHKYNGYEGLMGTKKGTLLTNKGKRLNTAKFYLENSKNLHVIKNSIVKNIIIDQNTKRASGVKIVHSSGAVIDIAAKKEIILSAGSIATPQILMLSGIGPKKHLEDIGIDCHLDLPVGQNLQDHLILPVFLKTNQHVILPPGMMNLLVLEYMLMRSGPISNIGITDFFGFINTKNSSDHPNIQFHHTYFTKNDSIMLRPYLEGIGYNTEIVEAIIALNKRQDMLGIYPTLLHPKSRGEILLRDSDLKSLPIIKTNYLQHPGDMQSIIEAIDFIHKLEKQEAFKVFELEVLEVPISGCSEYKFNTDQYWQCYIKHMATTVYHAVGTAKMGNDSTSVVNHDLLVRGLNNLRVVDASIMPSIPGANTMAATLAIAHKAVDIITQRYNYKDEL